jgi:capsular polysaccharide biosynthesis protein
MSTETVTVTVTHPDPQTAAEVAHAICTLVHQIAATPGGMPPDATITAENQHYPRTNLLPDLRSQP